MSRALTLTKRSILPLFFPPSISLPEKLEYITNKYAEHSHEKWSSEKVFPPSFFR